jgi:transcriptional regulator of met regulon
MLKFPNKTQEDDLNELTSSALIKNEIMIQVLSELLCEAKILNMKSIEERCAKKFEDAEKISKSIQEQALKVLKEMRDRMMDDQLKNTPDGEWGHS